MRNVEEIYQELLEAFAQRAGFTPGEGCDLAVRLWAAAAQIQALEIQTDWVLDQSFPQTAQGIYLDRHGAMRGISRQEALKAAGTLRFSVEMAPVSDLQIPAGTVGMTEAGIRFQTTEAAVLEAGALYTDARRRPWRAAPPATRHRGASASSRPARWPSPAARIPPPFPAAGTRRTTRRCGSGSWRATSACPTGPTPPGTSRRPWPMTAWRRPGRWAGARGTGTVDVYVTTEEGVPGAGAVDGDLQAVFQEEAGRSPWMSR